MMAVDIAIYGIAAAWTVLIIVFVIIEGGD